MPPMEPLSRTSGTSLYVNTLSADRLRPPQQDKLIPVLRPLHKLAHLRAVLQSDVRDRAYTAMADSDEFLGTVRGDAFDFAGTSASLARSLPSLRFVFLTTRGEHPSLEDARSSPLRGSWDVSRGWRVAELARGTDRMRPDDGGPELVELHGEVMATLIRTQELVLSDDEEVSTPAFIACMLKLIMAMVSFSYPQIFQNRS